eukprot:3119237-Pyramimonas_sp.AAC.1
MAPPGYSHGLQPTGNGRLIIESGWGPGVFTNIGWVQVAVGQEGQSFTSSACISDPCPDSRTSARS